MLYRVVVRRIEDRPLLLGSGSFAADCNARDQLTCVSCVSPSSRFGNSIPSTIRLSEAAALRLSRRGLTIADVVRLPADRLSARWASSARATNRQFVLAIANYVRYVGEPRGRVGVLCDHPYKSRGRGRICVFCENIEENNSSALDATPQRLSSYSCPPCIHMTFCPTLGAAALYTGRLDHAFCDCRQNCLCDRRSRSRAPHRQSPWRPRVARWSSLVCPDNRMC